MQTITRILVLLLFVGGVNIDAQSFVLPDPGLTPESPLYFLDIWDEKARLFFTRSDSARFKHYTKRVQERLAEADKLAGRGIAATQKALDLYRADLPFLYAAVERFGNKLLLIDALRMATDHLSALDSISERTDFERKRFILAAKIFIIDEQLQTLEFFAKQHPKDALHLFTDALQQRMDRIREVAIDKENNEEALGEYAAYLSEVDSILREWKVETVHDVSPAAFLEIAVRGHEEILLGPVRKRLTPVLERELLFSVNKVRQLSNLPPLTGLPPRADDMMMPDVQPPIPVPSIEPSPQPIPSPQPTPTPLPEQKPIPKPTPQPVPEPQPSPAPPLAPTVSLSANPSTISQGNSSTLSWSSTSATNCAAGGGWNGTKTTFGSLSVTPSATIAYILSCTGAGGNVSRSVIVTVTTSLPPPPTRFLNGIDVKTVFVIQSTLLV